MLFPVSAKGICSFDLMLFKKPFHLALRFKYRKGEKAISDINVLPCKFCTKIRLLFDLAVDFF